MNKTVVVQDKQTLDDIAIQEYGSVEGVALLLQENSDQLNSMTDLPVPGSRLKINSGVINKNIVNLYRSLPHKPVSLKSYNEIIGDYNDDYSMDYFI